MSEENDIIAAQKRVIELQNETIALLEAQRDELKVHNSVLLTLSKEQAEVIEILAAENIGIVAMLEALKREAEEQIALIAAQSLTDAVN